MIDALKDEIRPKYRKNPGLKRLFHRDSANWRKLIDNTWKSLQPLRDELPGWARRFRLVEDKDRTPAEWVLDAAVGTLLAWERHRSQMTRSDLWGLSSPIAVALSPEERLFKFVEYWEPGLKTERDFEKACRAQFEEALKRFKRGIHDVMKTKRGWKKTPTKRRRDSRSALEHFWWLAAYQVGELSPAQVVKKYPAESGMDESAVLHGVRGIADLIGLALRPRKSRR